MKFLVDSINLYLKINLQRKKIKGASYLNLRYKKEIR